MCGLLLQDGNSAPLPRITWKGYRHLSHTSLKRKRRFERNPSLAFQACGRNHGVFMGFTLTLTGG